MISFLLWFLLLVAAPVLTKSIGQSEDGYQPADAQRDDELAFGRSSARDKFLHISHKRCQGPEGQQGTCMFNYECQQQNGRVVGACLDGFLFGACCHEAEANQSSAEETTLTDTSVVESFLSSQSSTLTESVIDLSAESLKEKTVVPSGVRIPSKIGWDVPGLESSNLINNNSSISWPSEVASHLPLVLMFLNKSSSTNKPEEISTATESIVTKEPSTMTPITAVTLTTRLPSRTKDQPPKRTRTRPPGWRNRTVSTTTAASTTVTEATTSSTTVESLADQQSDVLQFLVRDPPAWVLEEIFNSSTLTTWYPLPIPDSLPANMVDLPQGEFVSPASVISTSLTKPMKPVINHLEVHNDLALAEEITSTTTTTTTTTEATTTSTRKPRPIYDYHKDCGVRPMAPEARIVGGRRADYGRWPWQVLIRESTWFGIFSKNKCGGVLISDRHVLTAAHCQPGFLGSLLVLFGEFDLTGHSEPNTPVEKAVKRVVIHRDYVERTFENDLAILELESPVEFRPYIVPICLPQTSEGDFNGRKAEVTGWGKLSHNGPTPGVLFEVDVPVMSNTECHDMFKKAGHEKRILDSFVCAGYAEGKKDSCEGDSGGPLMVERDDGRWTLVGTVSHGIRCAYPNMPGVYMRMTYYRPWIERVTGIGGTLLG